MPPLYGALLVSLWGTAVTFIAGRNFYLGRAEGAYLGANR